MPVPSDPMRPQGNTPYTETFHLIPDAQVLSKTAAPTPDFYILAIEMLPKALEADMDMILGIPFLQRFHAVFDASPNSKRIGLSPNQDYLIPVNTA